MPSTTGECGRQYVRKQVELLGNQTDGLPARSKTDSNPREEFRVVLKEHLEVQSSSLSEHTVAPSGKIELGFDEY